MEHRLCQPFCNVKTVFQKQASWDQTLENLKKKRGLGNSHPSVSLPVILIAEKRTLWGFLLMDCRDHEGYMGFIPSG